MDQSHIALYRRFRPMTFDEIVDQKSPVSALRQSVTSGKIGHAYIFCGQRGTGKTTIAKVFSRAINCENPSNGNPCNNCPTCKGILDGSLLDVTELDAASNNGVDDIRRICDEVNFAPTKAKYKVYIIDEVHMLSQGAFNALLKTLEEPPSHTVFLFATTESHKIPPTILSRCQRYDFKRIPIDSITSRLRHICTVESIDADDESLRLIASLSDGALRDSISLLDTVTGAIGNKKITAEAVEEIAGTVDNTFLFKMGNALIDSQYDELFFMFAKITESGRDRIRFVLDLAQYFRDLLVIRVVPDPRPLLNYSPSTIKEMYHTANKVSADTIVGFITYLNKMVSDMKWSPAVSTSFETGLIRLCGRKAKLEPAPLVIPDFIEKQAAASKTISSEGFSSVSVPAPEVKEETPAPAPVVEEKKEETTSLFSSSSSSLSALDRLQAMKSSLSSKPAEEPKKEEETAPVVTIEEKPEEKPSEDIISIVTESAPAPVTEIKEDLDAASPEEETDPEDIPMENQVDIFSMMGAPMDEPTPPPAPEAVVEHSPIPEFEPISFEFNMDNSEKPKEEEPATNADNNVLAGFSEGSFLDDIEVPSFPGSEPDLPIGETRKTSLSSVYDKGGLIVNNTANSPEVREPSFNYEDADNFTKWRLILNDLSQTNPNMYQSLSESEFKTINDNAYIVFDDKLRSLVKNIASTNEFKKVSARIKSEMTDINHVFVCTKKQYIAAENKLGANNSTNIQDDILDRARQMGIDTDLHFGDD